MQAIGTQAIAILKRWFIGLVSGGMDAAGTEAMEAAGSRHPIATRGSVDASQAVPLVNGARDIKYLQVLKIPCRDRAGCGASRTMDHDRSSWLGST
jgi:hypothetical protein